MDPYLQELIERIYRDDTIGDPKPGIIYSTEQSDRFKALREAEKLTNHDYIDQLSEYIPTEKVEKKRDAAYFILGHLLAKIPDNKNLQFFIDRLYIESNKYILGYMLDRIAQIKIPAPIDITPILRCMESDKWQIRISAISALHGTNHPAAKERLRPFLKLPDQKKSKYDITSAIAALARVGDKSDIERLQPFTSSRIRDIKDVAQFAIAALEQRYLEK